MGLIFSLFTALDVRENNGRAPFPVLDGPRRPALQGFPTLCEKAHNYATKQYSDVNVVHDVKMQMNDVTLEGGKRKQNVLQL